MYLSLAASCFCDTVRVEATSAGAIAASMNVRELSIQGLLLITPSKFADDRGFVSEVYNSRELAQYIGEIVFVQDNHALSKRAGTVRGLHFQAPPHAQGKLVRVVQGRAYDVAVDIRRGSPTFGRHVAVELSPANWGQLWIPAGFAHGFCTLEDDTEVAYKLTGHYSPEHDKGIFWNDPALGIEWPVIENEAILSRKDLAQGELADLPAYFSFCQ